MSAAEGSQDAEEAVAESSDEAGAVVGLEGAFLAEVGWPTFAAKSSLLWWKLLAVMTVAGPVEKSVETDVGQELDVGAVLVAEGHTLGAGHRVVVGLWEAVARGCFLVHEGDLAAVAQQVGEWVVELC